MLKLSYSCIVITIFLKRYNSDNYCLQTINTRLKIRQNLKILVFNSDTVVASVKDYLSYTWDLKLMLIILKNRDQKDLLLILKSSVLNSKDNKRVMLLRI